RYSIIAGLIISEGSLHIWRFYRGVWFLQTSLPFHLCGISIVLSIIMMINGNHFIFRLTYFWGLIGAFIAVITPALNVTYTHFRFWQFLLAHAFIVIAVMFMVIVEQYKINYKTIWKTFGITNLYMLTIGLFNWLTGSNYLYLCEKPVSSSPTPYDFLGPWPWYIFVLEVVAIVTFHIWFLPYLIFNKEMKKQIKPEIIK
ncbi:MAG: TIGR02206 family membrane protein, partial [Bacillota bacterium]